MGTEFELENWLTDKKLSVLEEVSSVIDVPTHANNDNKCAATQPTGDGPE